MTPSPEESTLKRRLQEILTGFKHGVQKKQGGYGYEEATHQLNLIIQERERLARIDELENIAKQYGEFRDETTGKTIDLKAVTLYRITNRINQLEAVKVKAVKT